MVEGGCCYAGSEADGVECPERLLEEFVKVCIQELEESKRVVGKMKEAHEQILELTGIWGSVERVGKAREGGGEAQIGSGGGSC